MYLVFFVAILLMPSFAWSYIGPGMGAGAIAVFLGVIGAVFIGLFAVLYYPIKRMVKKLRAASNLKKNPDDSSSQPS